MPEKFPDRHDEQVPMNKAELALVEKIAARDGISVEQAASNLGKAALARRAKKRSAGGARVLPIRKR